MSGPGGKNEATGDNIRKDGTDADNADGKSAQLDSTAQPDRSGPNGGPSGHWETRPVYETQRVQVPTGRAIFCLCSMVLRPVERLVFSPKER